MNSMVTVCYRPVFNRHLCQQRAMQQTSNRLVVIAIAAILLALYSLKPAVVRVIDDEDETSVSLCQIHARVDALEPFNDRTLLSLLVTLKMFDFQIRPPVRGPSDTLLYLCEHRLKAGPKQSSLARELNSIIRHDRVSSADLAWTCA